MTTHAVHHDMHTYGLADDCERCAEHAARPVDQLDATMLSELLARNDLGLGSRSENEATALRYIRRVLLEAAFLAAGRGPAWWQTVTGASIAADLADTERKQ